MSMMQTEMSQIACEHHSFRVTAQTPMPNLHDHVAKSARAKLKIGRIFGLILIKKQKKSSMCPRHGLRCLKLHTSTQVSGFHHETRCEICIAM